MKGLAGLAICPASAFLTITSCPQCPWLYQLLHKGYHGGTRGGKLSMVSVKFLSPCQAFQLVCSWHTWVCGQNKGEPGPVTGIDVLVDIVDVLWRRGRLVLRHVASIFTHHVAFLTVLRHEQCNSHLQKKQGAGGSGAHVESTGCLLHNAAQLCGVRNKNPHLYSVAQLCETEIRRDMGCCMCMDEETDTYQTQRKEVMSSEALLLTY